MTPAAVTISGEFIDHLRQLLIDSIEYAKRKRPEQLAQYGFNASARHGLSAFILAAASIEAVVNESFLGGMSRSIYKSSSLWSYDFARLERLGLGEKVLLIPQLLFGATLEKGAQPFQDFRMLLSIRNDLVHYKMEGQLPKYVRALSERGIALNSGVAEADYPWPHKLRSMRCVLWAHNVACKIALALEALVPENERAAIFGLADNYRPISKEEFERWFSETPNLAQPSMQIRFR